MLNYYSVAAFTLVIFLQFNGISSDATKSIDSNVALDYTMDRSVRDLFDETSVGEARSITFDRFGAFNTSLAFWVPLFIWKLPGVVDAVASGQNAKPFGVVATLVTVLVGGLGIAIHTITNGGISEPAPEEAEGADAAATAGRSFGGRRLPTNGVHNLVYNAIERFPEVLDLKSCVQFSVCESHADPDNYGLLSLAIRHLIPVKVGMDGKETSDFEQAALYGLEQRDDCHYEYPCLIQSLIETAIYGKDVAGSIMESYK